MSQSAKAIERPRTQASGVSGSLDELNWHSFASQIRFPMIARRAS